MTFALTATAQIDTSYTPPLPDGFATGSKRIFQAHVDARQFVATQGIAYLSWNGELSMASGGVNNSFTLTIGAINVVVLYASNTYKPFSYGGGTITQTKIEGGGGTLGGSAAWWYVYCYNNGGSIDFEISITVPNASRTLKNGDATRVYLGCFRAGTGGAPMAFRAARGRYVYRSQQLVLNAGGTAAATTQIIRPSGTTETPLVPPHGRIAVLDVRIVAPSSAADVATATIYGNADSTTPETALTITTDELDTTAYVKHVIAEVELNSSQETKYALSTTGGAPTITIYARGWQE